jgi:type VI secretion system protein ImpI
MVLILRIENETSLPDGGPLSVTVNGRRTIDIGREQHLDWTLPDPTRFISGKHCEVRCHDGAYWLYDLSTNGTFVNGSPNRVQSPYRLRNNDRVTIGHYIILVSVEGDVEHASVSSSPISSVSGNDLWLPEGEAAPPVPRSALQSSTASAARPDFLDWAADIPRQSDSLPGDYSPVQAHAPSESGSAEEFSWARSTPGPPPPEEPLARSPNPRRPLRDLEPGSPWSSEAAGEKGPAERNMPTDTSVRNSATARQIPVSEPGSLVQDLAAGAGISPGGWEAKEPGQLAQEIGRLMRLVVDNLRQLLQARVQAKKLARLSSHTMVQAADNNPLKFAPTSEDALRIMFGPRTSSYLDASQAFEQAFRDLKTHELKTFSAMQNALVMLMHELDPVRAEEDVGADRGISALISSRKAKLWDVYVARWKAKTGGTEAGLIEIFMRYFAESYERGQP